MTSRTRNNANAVKHGAFAKILFLPWEDPRDFEKLHADLVAEWKPVGPTEQDAVFSIAKGMWRKRRIQYFLECEMVRCGLDPKHQAYDEASALSSFSHAIALETLTDDDLPEWKRIFDGEKNAAAFALLRPQIADYFKTQVSTGQLWIHFGMGSGDPGGNHNGSVASGAARRANP